MVVGPPTPLEITTSIFAGYDIVNDVVLMLGRTHCVTIATDELLHCASLSHDKQNCSNEEHQGLLAYPPQNFSPITNLLLHPQ